MQRPFHIYLFLLILLARLTSCISGPFERANAVVDLDDADDSPGKEVIIPIMNRTQVLQNASFPLPGTSHQHQNLGILNFVDDFLIIFFNTPEVEEQEATVSPEQEVALESLTRMKKDLVSSEAVYGSESINLAALQARAQKMIHERLGKLMILTDAKRKLDSKRLIGKETPAEEKVFAKMEKELKDFENEIEIVSEEINNRVTSLNAQRARLVTQRGNVEMSEAAYIELQVAESRVIPPELVEEDFLKGVKGRDYFIAAAAGVGITAGALLTYYLLNRYVFKKEDLGAQERSAILDSTFSPKIWMKEMCASLGAAAVRVEGIAEDESSVGRWKSDMSSLEPVYARAYDQATDFGIKSLTDAGDQAWTPSTPPPVTPPPYHMDFFPIRTATKDQMVLLTQHLETKKNWTMKEFLEPVYAQYHFVQEYYDSVHEAAFYLMKNTTVLPYPTNSKRFNKAYTGTFTRLGIPTRCFTQIDEEKSTAIQFKRARKAQTLRETRTQVALHIYFAARPDLPQAPFLPASPVVVPPVWL